jgi:hypothetical protein
VLKESSPKGVTIQRYKGLGEMNASQLDETTIKPGRRSLLRVTVEDAVKANGLSKIRMGEEVEPRRPYVEEHAVEVTTLDIYPGPRSAFPTDGLLEGSAGIKRSNRMPGFVPAEPSEGRPIGLAPRELRDGEAVLHHWSSPHGLGVLTNQRCVLLGHPHPVRRDVQWSVALDAVGVVEVGQLAETPHLDYSGGPGMRGVGSATGVVRGASLAGSFVLRVDGVHVAQGTSEECAKVQRWIGEARSARRAPGPPLQ